MMEFTKSSVSMAAEGCSMVSLSDHGWEACIQKSFTLNGYKYSKKSDRTNHNKMSVSVYYTCNRDRPSLVCPQGCPAKITVLLNYEGKKVGDQPTATLSHGKPHTCPDPNVDASLEIMASEILSVKKEMEVQVILQQQQ